MFPSDCVPLIRTVSSLYFHNHFPETVSQAKETRDENRLPLETHRANYRQIYSHFSCKRANIRRADISGWWIARHTEGEQPLDPT